MNWLKLSNKHSVSFILLFLSSTAVLSQNSLQDFKQKWPDFNELIIEDSQIYDISVQDKKLRIIQDNHFESMILTDNGISNNSESFSYSDLVKLISYDAYSVITDNGREKKIKVKQSIEKNARSSAIFYNDVKLRQLTFPNLEAGAKKVYDYQTEIVDPFLMHKYIFGSGLPVQKSSLEIRTQKDISIGYKIFNDPNNSIEFSKTEKKGKFIYKWTLNDIKPAKYEPNAPGYLYIMPHIDIFVKNYTVDNKNIDVLDDTAKLYKYYKGFVKNLNLNEDLALKDLALELTKEKPNNIEKIKSIFYWVKDNIKYIAFENGYEGFIPREASLVYERKFGDCKDMSSIITAMAKYAEIPNVSISWIGTRNIPYSYAELSTPAVDDHMIAVFKNGDEYIFLDATDKETKFGIPTAFIQGKEALYSEGENYKVIPVPIISAETNEVKENIKLVISNDKLSGNGAISFNGYNRSHLLMQIGDAANKSRFDIIKSLVLKGNNKFNLKDYKEENVADRDKPYVINYNFDLSNYIVKVDNDIYINLFLDRIHEKSTVEKDRVSQYEFDFLTFYNIDYELQVPENYSIRYLPKNFSIDNNLLKADFTYENIADKIILKSRITQKKIMFDKNDFELWNETIKKLKSNYTETLILTKKQ